MKSDSNNKVFSKSGIPSDALIARNNLYVAMPLDDELACIDEVSGSCIGLNSTGKMIWELLESPLTLHEIIEHISEAFADDNTNIPLDTHDFLMRLASLNIIVIHNSQ